MSDSMLQILINAKDNATAVMKGLGGTMDKVRSQASNLASSGLNQLNKGFQSTANVIKTGVLVGVVGLTVALGAFATKTIQAASQYQTSMVVLDITAGKFGVNTEKAKELATTLGKDLRIGSTTASESLQYLIRSGLTLEQSADMLKRFTNEAVTGKSSSIDLATAVKNLAFAYTTGNSALGNMSGISENFSDIEKKGLVILQQKGELLGLTVGKLDEAQKMQARYAGMIELTNLTMGSSERLQGTFGDNMLAIQARFQELQVELGTRFLPIMGMVSDAFLQFVNNIDISAAIDSITTAFNNLLVYLQPVFAYLRQNPLILQAIFIGLAGVIGTLVVGALLSMATAAIVAMAPFIALGTVVGLLFYAWQTNFYGIRDITQNVLKFIGEAFQAFGTFLLQNLDGLTQGIFEFANGAIGAFNSFVNFMVDTVAPIILNVVHTIGLIIKALIPIVAEPIAVIVETIGEFMQWLLPFMTPIWKQVLTTFGAIFKNVMLIVSGATKFIQGIFTEDWRKMLEGLIDMVSGLVGGIAAVMDGVINIVRLGIAKVLEMVMSIGENEWVKKGLDILGLGGAMDTIKNLKSELEKPINVNQDDVKGLAAQAKSFLGIDPNASANENSNAEATVDGIINGLITGLDEATKAITKADFSKIASDIRDGGSAIGKVIVEATQGAKDTLKVIQDNRPQLEKLGENEKGAIKGFIEIIGNGAVEFGKTISQVQTGAVEMPNMMEQAQGILDGAKSSLAQAEQAQKAKDQADAQKSILESQQKAISAVAGAGGESGGSGSKAKEETQAEKDLKVLKAQLQIMKDQANVDIEALQRQKENLQYEEAKLKLTQAKIELDTTQSDEIKKQIEDLREQKLLHSQIDVESAKKVIQDTVQSDAIEKQIKDLEKAKLILSQNDIVMGVITEDPKNKEAYALAKKQAQDLYDLAKKTKDDQMKTYALDLFNLREKLALTKDLESAKYKADQEAASAAMDAARKAKDDASKNFQTAINLKQKELDNAQEAEQSKYKTAQNLRDQEQRDIDLRQLELDRQIKDRQNKLANDIKPIEQKIANITINVQTLPGQSNEDIAQQVSQILAQQYNAA
jgi:hypothetical protein